MIDRSLMHVMPDFARQDRWRYLARCAQCGAAHFKEKSNRVVSVRVGE